jgi:hypothetical protein
VDYPFGFHVQGLRNPADPTDASPVLFLKGDTGLFALPAAFAGFTVLPWIAEDDEPGENWASDLRQLVGSGGEQAVRISDTPAGDLGRIFLSDIKSKTWDVQAAVISISQTAFAVTGPSGLQVGQVLWLEEEAVKITAIVVPLMGGTTSAITYNLTVSRGQCGSQATRHGVDTAAYGAGDDGTEDRLLLEEKPNFRAFRFPGSMYLFQHQIGGAAAAAILEQRNVFVDEAPSENDNEEYEVRLKDYGEVLAQHQFSYGPKEVVLKYKLQALTFMTERIPGGNGAARVKALTARAWLDRQGAEAFFPSEKLSRPGNSNLDGALVADLATRLFADPKVEHYAGSKAAGDWLYKITGIVLENVQLVQFGVTLAYQALRLNLLLDDAGDADSIAADDQGTLSTSNPFAPYAGKFGQGWSDQFTSFVQPGETAPTLEYRFAVTARPVEAYRYLMQSNGGGSGAPFDRLIGRIGLKRPDGDLSLGSVPSDPLAVAAGLGTKFLLELNEFFDEVYKYWFRGSDKFGDWLANVASLHALAPTPLSSGQLTLRCLARPADAAPSELAPTDDPVPAGERLDPLRAFLLLSGVRTLTLAPEFSRSVTLNAAKSAEDAPEPVKVRDWRPGNHITVQDVRSGHLAGMLRFFFTMIGGSPRRFSVATSLDFENHDVGDHVLWTDPGVAMPEGRGFSSLRFLVVGADVNWRTGIKTYRLMRDYYNEAASAQEGLIGPTLNVEYHRPGAIAKTYDLDLSSLGDSTFDATTTHQGIWSSLKNVGGWVRFRRPLQGVVGPLERDGELEWYGQVIAVSRDAGRPEISRMTVSIEDAWARGPYATVLSLFESGTTRLTLADRRTAEVTVLGSLIEPSAAQLAAGGVGFARVSGIQRDVSRNFTAIAA